MRRLFAIAIVVVAMAGVLRSASAQQTYPTRTVRLILPFGAASATDITARLLADRLTARWGKPVVVENRPGGDGLGCGVWCGVRAHDCLSCGSGEVGPAGPTRPS